MPQAKQVINGTWGEVWINGEYVSEVSALQAKVTLTKVDVNFTSRIVAMSFCEPRS